MSLSLSNKTKEKLPVSRAQFLRIQNAVLGRAYTVSVAFVAPAEMKRVNRIYRRRNEATDILSFPLGGRSGEILLCMPEVRRQARLFERSPKNCLFFLFIHGLLHLKGMRHGGTMEKQEQKFRAKFGI